MSADPIRALDAHAAADLMDGADYHPADEAAFAVFGAAGLVVVYGLSDDLIEVAGASKTEIDAYQGMFREGDRQDLRFTPEGLVDDHSPEPDGDLEHADAPAPEGAARVDVEFCRDDDLTWSFRTDVPHATFETTLHGRRFCRGIVFSLADVAAAA